MVFFALGLELLVMVKAWFRSGEARVPHDLAALLESSSSTKGMVVEQAIAEMPLRFDNFFGNPRKSDLVLFGQVGGGEGVLVAVEAKADEEFGPLIGEYRATKSRQVLWARARDGPASQ